MYRLIAVLLMSLASFAQAATQAEIAERIKQAESKGKEVLLAKLKDPQSAQFRNVRPSTDGLYLCGEVNSKNSYGGYPGFRKFYSLWQMNTASIQGEGDYIESIYQDECR